MKKKRNIPTGDKTLNYHFVFLRICILLHGNGFVPYNTQQRILCFSKLSKGINSCPCLDWKGFKIKQMTFIVFGIYSGRQDEDFLFSLLRWFFIFFIYGTLLRSGTRAQYTIIWLFPEKLVYPVKIVLSDNNGAKFTMLAKHVLIFNQAVV